MRTRLGHWQVPIIHAKGRRRVRNPIVLLPYGDGVIESVVDSGTRNDRGDESRMIGPGR